MVRYGRSLRNVHTLDLHRVFVNPYAVEAVADKFSDSLERLRPYAIGDAGAISLGTARFRRLESGRLDCCELTTLDPLMAASWMKRIRELDLSWNRLNNGPMGQLRELPALEAVDLRGNPIGFSGLVSAVDRLPALKRLAVDVDDCDKQTLQSIRPALELR